MPGGVAAPCCCTVAGDGGEGGGDQETVEREEGCEQGTGARERWGGQGPTNNKLILAKPSDTRVQVLNPSTGYFPNKPNLILTNSDPLTN